MASATAKGAVTGAVDGAKVALVTGEPADIAAGAAYGAAVDGGSQAVREVAGNRAGDATEKVGDTVGEIKDAYDICKAVC